MLSITELKIRNIGSKVRKACVTFAHSEEASNYDFFVYSYGEYDANLGGMCAIASFALRNELKAHGYTKAKVIWGKFTGADGGTHCWVDVDGKHLIDITATQFDSDLPSILVTKINDRRFIEGKPALRMRKFKDWPDSQRPSQDVVEIIQNIIAKKYTPTPIDKKLYDAGLILTPTLF